MTRSATGFAYSERNDKMNKVSSFSVMPLITCIPNAPCYKECYALRLTKRWKQVKGCYSENTKMLMDQKLYTQLVEDTIAYCKFMHTKYFRWNVAGDFFSKEYLKAAIEVARNCPETLFWAFTKQFGVLSEVVADMEKADEELPENFNIILSAWGTFMPPQNLMYRFGVCYVADRKGLFTVPTDAFVCEGDCEHCLKCSILKPTESVVIHQH